MKTTLDEMTKTLTLTRLEIERFKINRTFIDCEIESFLQQITNTLLTLQDKAGDLIKELEK